MVIEKSSEKITILAGVFSLDIYRTICIPYLHQNKMAACHDTM